MRRGRHKHARFIITPYSVCTIVTFLRLSPMFCHGCEVRTLCQVSPTWGPGPIHEVPPNYTYTYILGINPRRCWSTDALFFAHPPLCGRRFQPFVHFCISRSLCPGLANPRSLSILSLSDVCYLHSTRWGNEVVLSLLCQHTCLIPPPSPGKTSQAYWGPIFQDNFASRVGISHPPLCLAPFTTRYRAQKLVTRTPPAPSRQPRPFDITTRPIPSAQSTCPRPSSSLSHPPSLL